MDRKPHIIALIATLAVLILTLVVLMSTQLYFSSQELSMRQWPPVDTSELLLWNEYVAAGEVEAVENPTEASPVAESAPAPDAHDLTNEGEAAKTAPDVIASNRPSEMTVKKPKEEPKGSTKEEIEAAKKAKIEKETAQAISQRVNFGGKAAGGDGDNAPEANGSGGSSEGVASASMGGRSLAKWSKPSARATGTITVRVRVDRQGKVVRADYLSGTGSVAAQPAARQSCENAAMKSQFSVALDGPAVQVGTITYHFR